MQQTQQVWKQEERKTSKKGEGEEVDQSMESLDDINDSDLDMLLGELSIEEDIEDEVDPRALGREQRGL